MGENRQRYNEKLQERLRLRKKRIHDGEEVDDDDEELIEDDDAKTSGNVLKDLQLRYEQEKEALLRKLQVITKKTHCVKTFYSPGKFLKGIDLFKSWPGPVQNITY